MPFECFPCKLQKHVLISLLSPDLRAAGAAAPKLVADIEPIEHVFIDDLEVAEAIAVLQHELKKSGTPDELLDAGGQGGSLSPALAGFIERLVELRVIEGADLQKPSPALSGLGGISFKVRPRPLANGAQNGAGANIRLASCEGIGKMAMPGPRRRLILVEAVEDQQTPGCPAGGPAPVAIEQGLGVTLIGAQGSGSLGLEHLSKAVQAIPLS